MSERTVYANNRLNLKSVRVSTTGEQIDVNSTDTIHFTLPSLADFTVNGQKILTQSDIPAGTILTTSNYYPPGVVLTTSSLNPADVLTTSDIYPPGAILTTATINPATLVTTAMITPANVLETTDQANAFWSATPFNVAELTDVIIPMPNQTFGTTGISIAANKLILPPGWWQVNLAIHTTNVDGLYVRAQETAPVVQPRWASADRVVLITGAETLVDYVLVFQTTAPSTSIEFLVRGTKITVGNLDFPLINMSVKKNL